MGRTGKWWAIENFGAEPDIVCVAKGIASGVPLGATITRKGIMDWPRGSHGNTYGGNPIACAAALATIELLESEFMENARVTGQFMHDCLAEIATRHLSIGQVRGIGLMLGVEFVDNVNPRRPNEFLRDQVVDLSFERGLLLLGCGKSTIRFSPPLCVTRAEVEEGLMIFEEAVSLAEQKQIAP
jgi:4-aminobutyrate aminotransferase